MRDLQSAKLAVIGLGYVGLPLAAAFGRRLDTLGFDLKSERIAELRERRDHTLELSADELSAAPHLQFTDKLDELRARAVFIVTVPTPIYEAQRPDLQPLIRASEMIGGVLKRGDIVIYESTVYPGTTEEICGRSLERASGLRFNADFTCGYSPERINPGGRERRIGDIRKITSGSTSDAAAFVDALYAAIIPAGPHRAPSIRVAEAAKVIENVQRDVNIALINELGRCMSIHRRVITTPCGRKVTARRVAPKWPPYDVAPLGHRVGGYAARALSGDRSGCNAARFGWR